MEKKKESEELFYFMEKKQTAVEWLYSELSKNNISNDSIKSRIYKESEIWKQAKKMEKEQNEYFFNCGRQYQLTGEETFKQVHNETYGGQDESK